jgi:hypothetical protein
MLKTTDEKMILHFKYWIYILGALLIFSITFKYTGDRSFVDYVSFAATITSFVLAILAIVISLVENEKNQKVSYKLDASSDSILKSAASLSEVVNLVKNLDVTMRDKLNELPKEIIKLRNISSESLPAPAPTAWADKKDQLRFITFNTLNALKFLSYESKVKKIISFDEIIDVFAKAVGIEDVDQHSASFNYIRGYIEAELKAVQQIGGIKYKIDPKNQRNIIVEKIEESLKDDIDLIYKTIFEGRSDETSESVQKVSNYIDQLYKK